MTDAVNNFLAYLDREVEAYANLFSLLEDEHESLIKWDLDAATLILFRKEEILSSIKELEQQRLAAGTLVGNEFFPESDNAVSPTLSSIIEKCEGEDARHLMAVREKQIELVTNVRELNARNSLLMKRTMELISGSLDILMVGESKPMIYDRNGMSKRAPLSAKIIDGRA